MKEKILEFLKKNPSPTDDEFHSWAKSQGMDPDKAEELVYELLGNVAAKGESKGKVPPGTDPKQVSKGTKVELEHTPDKAMARKIALDHIKEHKGYYPALEVMEKNLEKKAMIDVFAQAFVDEVEKLAAKKKKWIQGAIKRPGALSRKLGVPEEENIPASKLRAAAKKPGRTGKQARLAITLKKLHKKKK